jgi:hypothetical protein
VYLALEFMQHTGRSRHGERWTSFGRNAMPGASPMRESRSFQAATRIWSVPRPRERKVFAQRCFHIPGATAIVDSEIAEGATVDHFEQGVPIVESGGMTS